MTRGLYSHFEWISYILCGLVIIVALDIAFADFEGTLFATSRILGFDSMKVVFVVAMAYLIGHANSHLAHWFLQEFMTALTFGRPSYWLLFGHDRYVLKYFRRLKDYDHQAICKRLEDEGYASLIEDRDDHHIFSIAFQYAQKGRDFNESHFRLLNAFNFSRNMTMALILTILIFLAFLVKGCPDGLISDDHLRCEKLYGEMSVVIWSLCAITIFIALRYLHFLQTYSAHVLREYGYGAAAPDEHGAAT